MPKLCFILSCLCGFFAVQAKAQDTLVNRASQAQQALAAEAKKAFNNLSSPLTTQNSVTVSRKESRAIKKNNAVVARKRSDIDSMLDADTSRPVNRVEDIGRRIYRSGDTTWILSGICKTLKRTMFVGAVPGDLAVPSKIREAFIQVHGNVQYDYLFRSFSDTPYYQKDFRQHTVQTSLTITLKNSYPFRLNLVVRKSNSPYFRDFFDGGMLFDRLTYQKNIKEQILARITKQLPGREYLAAAKALLDKKLDQYNVLLRKLNDPNLAQRLIEEREKKYFDSLRRLQLNVTGIEKPRIDTLLDDLEMIVAEKKKELDSLKQGIDRIKAQIDSIDNKLRSGIASIRQKFNKVRQPRDLNKLLSQYSIDDKRAKWEKFLGNLKTIGIGRSVLNYSELTARNVSLTGVNVEYNPRMYTAFAAGKIDYGFRDFFGRNSRTGGQYLILGRFGVGDLEKRAVIFSVYTGQKANYGAVLSDTVRGTMQVTGYSVETIIKKDENNFISAELAKSTRPVTGQFSDNKELGSLFRFSDQGNLGVSVKGQAMIEETDTRLSGMFRKTGENFQSFSLFNYNTDQTAWMMKLEQPFWKEKVLFSGMLRRNDFVNPFTDKTFKTSTVFGSVQATVRIPKWPSLSVGYFPGSQLYIVDRNKVRENVYYILNGTVIHQYKLAGIRMVSSAIYNKYTTKGTDSGFINYSGINYILSQNLYLGKFDCQANYVFTDQQELKFYTAEGNVSFQASDKFRIGGGGKYNKVLSGEVYWGGTAQLMFVVKQLGSLQLQFEKYFLPTIQRTLFPVEMGRLTWFKNF